MVQVAIAAPQFVMAWPLLGVETTEPAALSGFWTQNLSQSSSSVGTLSSCPAQPHEQPVHAGGTHHWWGSAREILGAFASPACKLLMRQ